MGGGVKQSARPVWDPDYAGKSGGDYEQGPTEFTPPRYAGLLGQTSRNVIPNYSNASPASSVSPASGIWNYGSVEDLSGRMPSAGPSQIPYERTPIQARDPWKQPEQIELWEHHPATYVSRRGLPSGSQGQQQSGTGQFSGLLRGFRGTSSPEYWTSSLGNKVYERPEMGPSWGQYREGGIVRRGYQEGGIASLQADAQLGGIGGIGAVSPVGASDPTMQGELNSEESYLMDVFEQARLALEGNHPNPAQALSEFEEAFGEEALEKLRRAVQDSGGEGAAVPIEEPDVAGGIPLPVQGFAAGGMVGMGSDGLSDSIPGRIGGVEEVALSEGEFVVPADAVSAAGNGSTDSGARRMTAMVDDIRRSRGAPGAPNELSGVGIEEIIRRYGRT